MSERKAADDLSWWNPDAPAMTPREKKRRMTPTIRRALDQAKREATCDYVVEWGGDQVRSVKKSVAAAAKRAGLPWVTPHVFRKTAARLMAEKGVSMDEIAQYLGHDDARTTSKIYARFSPSYLSGAASALDFE